MWLYNLLMKPTSLPYDFDEWQKLPFPERARKVCQAWGLQGFGAPPFAVIFYTLKIFFYVWIWTIFCSFSTELGGLDSIGEWWFKKEAMGKALLWTMLMEVIGLGGASGPLTARYLPPIGASTYWFVPGTIKVPVFRFLGDKRNIIDILLYGALLYFLFVGCIAPEVTSTIVLPVVILLPILGILDRSIYLAARADVYYPAIFVFLFPLETMGALQIVWFAIWFWAAFSKLTPTFTSVVSVMICNSPFLRFKWLKKLMFKNYPEDLRLSKTAIYISHFGTLVEFSLPILLMLGTFLGWSPDVMFYCLIGMTAFHAFIFINFPMGVPMEWNVIMVYGGWMLFGFSPDVLPTEVSNPLIIALFSVSLFALPILGNLFPKHISFLLSMRYYAGTWPFSIWLFKKGKKMEKLEPNIRKISPDLRKQLALFYDKKTVDSVLSRGISFRLMHLPSRVLHDVLPKAVDNIDDYYWLEGEFMAGEVVGWNFGDAHLHSERLLESVQKRCHFEEGELRVIMVESPQFHNGSMHWRIHDAKTGLIEEGRGLIKDMKERMPWPEWKQESNS
ncbi:MAG: DUF3556 domain-containing protein [Bacteroidia bacterium]|nr:DUF3556 domain-containing protein [Bacteroidia bacterium]